MQIKKRQVFSMATNPVSTESSWNWPSRGGAMSEAEFHELERLSPDRKYEYLNGMAYLMSGGSVAHDASRAMLATPWTASFDRDPVEPLVLMCKCSWEPKKTARSTMPIPMRLFPVMPQIGAPRTH